MTRPVYALHDVTHANSDHFTLQVDNLAVGTGETLCLLGPTGAGKSTLLRLLTGLESPTSGRICWFGRPLEASRRIAYVPQRPLPLTQTVRQNVGYGLRVRGDRSPRVRAGAMLEALGLSAIAEQDARTLSGGQMQLVALARALVVEPDFLLLDEPTAHLDPSNVALVERLILEHKQRLGMTVVWATHNLYQARRVASQVGLLLGGRLIEVADTETFFSHPADAHTIDFVEGKMVY